MGAGDWEEHDFLFHYFGLKNICSCRCSTDNLQTEYLNCVVWDTRKLLG